MSENNENYVDFNDDFIADAEIGSLDAWDGKGGNPVLAGSYVVSIDKVEQRTSKASGNPMLALEMRVLSTADGTGTSEEGRRLFAYYVQKGKGKKRLAALLQATGVLENGGYRRSNLVNKRLIVDVEHETSEYTNPDTGVTSPRVNARVNGERAVA